MEKFLGPLALLIYFVIYGLLHSLLASVSFKQRLTSLLGEKAMRGYRLFYNIFATVTLLPFFTLQTIFPNPLLYAIPSPWRWGMVVLQLLALIGAGITLLQTGIFHFIGLSQFITPQSTDHTPLNIQGFYRWVRHPLYSFSLIFIWFSPVMYLNQLIAYLLFSAYFLIGSTYEEDKLVAEFGETYQNYQQTVPRLFPFIRP